MKNIITRAAVMLCMLTTIFGFNSCSNDDDLGSAVELYAFGPTPVLRGEDIIFKGKGLDKVTEIILPDNISITEINRTSSELISITIPQEAVVGYVTLVYPGGSITTQTLLGFTEPYVITSISPVGTMVRAGDEITINGDYLNNITKVVFGGDAAVELDNFTAQSRKQIKLNLPEEAISGKLIVVDGNDNQLYSDQELSVMQPTISSIAPQAIKAGENLTINGANLDLAASVEFGGGIVVEEFVSQSTTKVVVASPAEMLEGAIILTSKAGQSVVSETALECIVPTNVAIAATDRYKAGMSVEITGQDLDLVTAVQFAGSAAVSEFTFADDKITTTIPADAVDGEVTLTTAATKTVMTPAITLVKPVVVSLESIDILSGEDIVAHGNDLDLVTSVTLAGTEMEFTYDSATGDIVVATVRESKSGALEFITANKNSTHIATVTVTLDSIVKVTEMPESASAGDEITIVGVNFNHVESMSIGEAKVIEYTNRADDTMSFIMPEVEAGEYPLTFNLTTGEVETSVGTITIGQLFTTVELWNGSLDLGGWGSSQALAWGEKPAAFNDIPYGATIHFDFTPTGTPTQLKICDPDGWVPWPETALQPGYNGDVVELAEGVTTFGFEMTDATVDNMRARGTIISGKLCIVTRVYYTY